jgi:sulfite dehydrogenase (quinone) subunit SoeB
MARAFNEDQGVMKKGTLCLNRICNEALSDAEREPASAVETPHVSAVYCGK